jgi:hypothetical protein
LSWPTSTARTSAVLKAREDAGQEQLTFVAFAAPAGQPGIQPLSGRERCASKQQNSRKTYDEEERTKKAALKAFRAFGLDAMVWPPNAKYGEDALKIRIGRSFRDKNGAFKTTTSFSPEKLAVQMEQALKAIAFIQPELVEPTMKSLTEIVKHRRIRPMPKCLDLQRARLTSDYQAGQAYDGDHKPQCRGEESERIIDGEGHDQSNRGNRETTFYCWR